MDPVTIQLYITLAVQVIEAGKDVWSILKKEGLTDAEINAIELAANQESARRKAERELMGREGGGL